MLKMKKISETFDMRVFTDNGDYFGDGYGLPTLAMVEAVKMVAYKGH